MTKKRGFIIFSRKAINNRMNQMRLKRDAIIADGVEKYHVRLMSGNSKTGINCRTCSLIPGVDCSNCVGKDGIGCLYGGCYDIQNVCWLPDVQETRAINSAIHKEDPERYWAEMAMQVRAQFVTELRINVGGDLTNKDFFYIENMGKANRSCHHLFFTKNDHGIAKFIEACGGIENTRYFKNVHPVLSAWKGMDLYNPYNLPVAHVKFPDGTCTAEDWELVYVCGGNCSECFYHYANENKKASGCWGLKCGEAVLFDAH